MQIRIKRAGWLLLCGAAVIIACVAIAGVVRAVYLGRQASLPSFAAEGFSAKTQVATGPTKSDKDLLASASETLKNPSFEDGFDPAPAPEPGQPAHITGNIPKGWFDLSKWSDLDVQYDQDSGNVHTGKSSLRMDLGDVRRQAVLLAQPMKLKKGHTYTASVWLQASKAGTPVNFGLRMRGKPYRFYQEKSASVGTQWQKVEVTAQINDDRYPVIYFLLEIYSPHTTLWVDDAVLLEGGTETPGPAVATKTPGA